MKHKKRILLTFLLICSFTNELSADTKLDTYVNAINIKVTSQSLAKNYLYIHQNLQVESAKVALKKNILLLDQSINNMKHAVLDDESKELVEFMSFSSEELKNTLKESYNKETGGLLLDYSESLLEGSDIISKKYIDTKNTMLETVKEMMYLLERAAKYYIAFKAGYKDSVNIEQAQETVEKFDTLLKKVQLTQYPDDLKNSSVKKLLKYWPVSKNFYLGIKEGKLPSIVFISTKHMKKALNKLAEYHQKNFK